MIYLLDNPEFDEFCLEERILEVATLNDAQSLSNLVFAYPELKLETMLFKLLKSRVEIAISPKQTSRILDICSKFVLEDQEYQAVVENLKKTGKTPEISNKKWKNLKQKAINQSKKIS